MKKIKLLLLCFPLVLSCIICCCTKEIHRPTVTINTDACSCNSQTGTINIIANVYNAGDEINDAGICYTTSSNTPTVNDIKKSIGANQSNISVTLNNLPAATYNIRAYATNRLGTEYSDVVKYKITLLPDPPKVKIKPLEWGGEGSYSLTLHAVISNYSPNSAESAGFTVKKYSTTGSQFGFYSDNDVYSVNDWKIERSDNLEGRFISSIHKEFYSNYNYFYGSASYRNVFVVDAYATNRGGTGHDKIAFYYNSETCSLKEIDASRLSFY